MTSPVLRPFSAEAAECRRVRRWQERAVRDGLHNSLPNRAESSSGTIPNPPNPRWLKRGHQLASRPPCRMASSPRRLDVMPSDPDVRLGRQSTPERWLWSSEQEDARSVRNGGCRSRSWCLCLVPVPESLLYTWTDLLENSLVAQLDARARADEVLDPVQVLTFLDAEVLALLP